MSNEQHNLQQAMAMSQLVQTGDVTSLVSDHLSPRHHYEPLKEVLNTSTVTTEIEQILTPLERDNEPLG